MILRFVSALGWVLAWLILTPAAHADMELSPLRHVISSENPVAEFVVSNPSDRLLEGRVSWVDFSATKTGYELAGIQARQNLSAAPYLEVSPAFFSLEPGNRISVTIKLREGADIPEGERRSHLLIETAAARTVIRKAGNSGLQVDVGLGMSAPVFLRSGGSAKAEITSANLLRNDEGALSLSVLVTPLGSISAFGELEVLFRAIGEEGFRTLTRRANIASYIDTPNREYELPLNVEELGSGKLAIKYWGAQEFAGQLFDEKSYSIAPPK